MSGSSLEFLGCLGEQVGRKDVRIIETWVEVDFPDESVSGQQHAIAVDDSTARSINGLGNDPLRLVGKVQDLGEQQAVPEPPG